MAAGAGRETRLRPGVSAASQKDAAPHGRPQRRTEGARAPDAAPPAPEGAGGGAFSTSGLARGPADAGTSARRGPQQTSGLQDPKAASPRRSNPPSPWEAAAAAAGIRRSWPREPGKLAALKFHSRRLAGGAPTRRKENQAQGRGALSMRRGRPEAGGEQCGAHALRAWRARVRGPRTPRRRWDGTATLTQPLHLTPGTEIPPRAPQTPWRGSTRPPRGRGPPRGRCTAGAWDALARAQPRVRASVSFQTNSRVAPAGVTRKPVPRTSL